MGSGPEQTVFSVNPTHLLNGVYSGFCCAQYLAVMKVSPGSYHLRFQHVRLPGLACLRTRFISNRSGLRLRALCYEYRQNVLIINTGGIFVNLKRSVELMERYQICETCGNEAVGNGEGTLKITGSTFIRTCKCGWKVEIKEEQK